MSSELKTTWSWEEWQASRAARRSATQQVGPESVRRRSSSSDRRLRKQFKGKRGPEFSG